MNYEFENRPKQSEAVTRSVSSQLTALGENIGEAQTQGLQTFTHSLSRTSAEAVAFFLSPGKGKTTLEAYVLTYMPNGLDVDIEGGDRLKIKNAAEALQEAFKGKLAVMVSQTEKGLEDTQLRLARLERQLLDKQNSSTGYFLGGFTTPFEA